METQEKKSKNKFLTKLLSFFDRSFWIFLLIGAGNTVISLGLQYLFYTLNFGYWLSTSLAFTICSIISFFCNKKFSFKNTDKIWKTAIKFAVVIAVCYLVAYSVAQPLAKKLIESFYSDNLENMTDIIDKCAMLLGQVVFTLMNYVGQRFFAFRNKKEDKQEK